MTTNQPKITTKKVLDRRGKIDHYDVMINDVRAGWVVKADQWSTYAEGTWTFYASIKVWFKGEPLATERATRNEAIYDGLSELRIHHAGQVYSMGTTLQDVYDKRDWFDEDTLRAAEKIMLNKMYPLSAGLD